MVKIGKVIYEEKVFGLKNVEILIDNIKLDRFIFEYLIEIKKLDVDIEVGKW